MKNFNQLTIGDKFYRVYTNYEGKDKPKFSEIIVARISKEETKSGMCIVINERGGFGNNYNDFTHIAKECNSNLIKNNTEGYFTTDLETVQTLLKDAAIGYIREQEMSIEKSNKEISRIRLAYWDYLNPKKELV